MSGPVIKSEGSNKQSANKGQGLLCPLALIIIHRSAITQPRPPCLSVLFISCIISQAAESHAFYNSNSVIPDMSTVPLCGCTSLRDKRLIPNSNQLVQCLPQKTAHQGIASVTLADSTQRLIIYNPDGFRSHSPEEATDKLPCSGCRTKQ